MESPRTDLPVFTGEFRHAMDAKNRVTIPSRWRQGGTEEFFAIANPQGGCLIVMPPLEFRRQVEEMENDPGLQQTNRKKFVRLFSARTQQLTGDKQGRIVLPDEQCKQLQLQGDVVLVGAYSRFEIWNPVLWKEKVAREESEFAAHFERVGG